MNLSTLVRRLARNDLRLVLRDRMLIMLLAMVVVMGVVARYVLPVIDTSLAENGVMPSKTVPMRFADIFPVFVAFIGLWQAALMPGTAFGFLLLDEKEDDTLTAMRTTPVPLSRYLGYRVALPTVLAFVFAMVLEPFIGHTSTPWTMRLLFAFGASWVAPITMLALASFAANKVQGLAITKFGGVAGLIILFGWFVPEPFQWLLGLFPPFLVCKAYWMALEGHSWWPLVLAVGTVAQVGLLWLLVRRFQRAV